MALRTFVTTRTLAALPVLFLSALWLLGASTVRAQEGNPIISTPSVQTSAPANVNVTIQPPAPDPQATRAMYGYVIATTEYDHFSVPVNWATGLLQGANIWTRTPTDHFETDLIRGMRNSARSVALGLFLLGVVWTGVQLVAGSALGTTSYQQLLPMLVAGFMVAWYADSIAHRAIDLSNWLCERLASPSLTDFTGEALNLPNQPDTQLPGIVQVPASFFSGLLTSLVYAVVLIVLELKMIFREAILQVTDVVMPISGVLWAFSLTRGWGVQLFRLFFGWLFGQPLVVVCLALGSSLLTLFNTTDGPGQVLVKVAILMVALKMVSFLSGASLGGSGMFGMAGLLFLLRQARGMARRGGAATGDNQPPPQNAAAVQPGRYNGSGDGTAATGRPWRPAMGTA